jgi:hypothetical protein
LIAAPDPFQRAAPLYSHEYSPVMERMPSRSFSVRRKREISMMRMCVGALTGALLVASLAIAAENKSAESTPTPTSTGQASASTTSTASGGVSQGSAALMLASLVAPYAPDLDAKRRVALTMLGDNGASIFERIELKAADISCRTSNVTIGAYGCDLKFPNGVTTALKGRKAHELYATLLENGIPVEGAAGSIQANVKDLKCVIEPRVLAQNAGGGAYCGWTAP